MSFTYKRLDKNDVTVLLADHQAGLRSRSSSSRSAVTAPTSYC